MQTANVVTMPARTRTHQEIAAELMDLDSLRGRLPLLLGHSTANERALEAEILVIEDELSGAEAVEVYDDGTTEAYVVSAALNAAEWLIGEAPAPSSGWLDMIGKGPGRAWVN